MIEVDKKKLEELVKNNEKVFVYFYSDWHTYSKMMFNDLKKLQNQIDVPIAICNIDYNYDLGHVYKVRGLPTFGRIDRGEIVKVESSVKTIDYLKDFILN